MKKPLMLLAGGAALFAAGYWTKSALTGDGRDARESGRGAVAASLTEDPVAGGKAPGNTGVRPVTPGRPFARGQAREWLLGLVPSLSVGAPLNTTIMAELTPVFLTMDEASAQEAFTALDELAALHKNGAFPAKGILSANDVMKAMATLTLLRLAGSQPEKVAEFLRASPHLLERDAMLLVFGRMAAHDAERAAQLALSLKSGDEYRAMDAVLYSLAGKNPAEALRFAGRYPDQFGVEEECYILGNWSRYDPKGAVEAAVGIMQKHDNPEIMRRLFDDWFFHDPKGAGEWASHWRGPGRLAAMATVLEDRARKEPEAARPDYMKLLQSGGDPKELTSLTETLTFSLAKEDPAGIRQWVQDLPAGPVQEAAMRKLTEQWLSKDPEAASGWVKSLPPGESRDHAAQTLARTILRAEPASAFEWAVNIRNVAMRDDALHRVLVEWSQQDSDAASAAIKGLPPEIRSHLHEYLQEDP